MRFLAWVLQISACVVTALAALALIELAGAPPLLRELPASDDAVLLTVMTPKGLVVIRQSSAWLVRASLEAQLLGWPDTVPGIAEVRSVDWRSNQLALLVKKLDGRSALLRLDEDRVVQVPIHSGYDPVAVHHGDLYFVASGEGVSALCSSSWKEVRITYRYDCHRLQTVSPEALRGLAFDGDDPVLAFGEPGQLSLVDADENPWQVPLEVHGPAFLPPRQGPAPALYVDDSARGTLQVVGREVALRRERGRILIDRQGKLQAIASSRAPGGGLVAHKRRPDGWLVLSERADEGLLLDEKLQRADEGHAPLALTGLSARAWLAILSLLGLALLALPISWWRARRRFAGFAGARTLVGTLKLPPCESLEGTGRLALPKGSLLVVRGIEYELSSGLMQLDGGAPLVDGDTVCVVGVLERGESGGPWREGGPRRIVPDGGRYAIARGESSEWAAPLRRRVDARFFALAAACLSVAAVAERLLSRF